MSGRHTLSWRTPITTETHLPPQIKRTYVRTPYGPLELLIALPPPSEERRKKALIFQHGGFGSAGVWIPFLLFFSQKHGHPCYAASLRGHGASWNPGFLRMVFATGKASMAEDLGYVVNYLQGFEASQRGGEFDQQDLVIVGHSAGGGLAQYFLSKSLGQVGGLVLVASFPNFGGLGVYWNWARLDPLFALRMYFRDLGHPRSPLSSTTLVHRAFFCKEFSQEKVVAFEPHLSEYESVLWPLGMMLPFVNIGNVIRNVLGWRVTSTARVLVVSGGKDKLMSVKLMKRMADHYKSGFDLLLRRKQVQLEPVPGVGQGEGQPENPIQFAVIEGSGHHVQNDLQWEDAASQILNFISRL